LESRCNRDIKKCSNVLAQQQLKKRQFFDLIKPEVFLSLTTILQTAVGKVFSGRKLREY
jgi:hypothetical protein